MVIRPKTKIPAIYSKRETSEFHTGRFPDDRAGYEDRYHKAAERLDRLLAGKEQHLGRQKAIRLFNDSLREQPLVLSEWDLDVWCLLVNKVTVNRDGTLFFTFKGENEITVRAE